jgi:FG-GAP-like repeat
MTSLRPLVFGLLLGLTLGACGDDDDGVTSLGGGGSGGAGPSGSSGSAGGPGCAGAFERLVLHTEFYSEGAAYGDFDRDGVTDVVAGPYWYAGPSFTAKHELYEPVAFDPKGYSDNFFAWARDFNGDGWLDVLTVGFPGRQAAWFENPREAGGRWPRHLVFEIVDDESPEFVDLTGDGAPELVFATGGALGWAAPSADPNAPWVFHPLSPQVGFATFTHGLGVGDVDGDARLDVLEASGWWQQPASLEGDPLWARHDMPFVPGGAQMYAFDVDDDGDNDVVSTREAHGYGISWFEQTPGGFAEHAIAPADPRAAEGPVLHEPHALARADLNGDGLPDLVGGERFWGHVPEGDPSFSDPAKLYWFELERGAQGPRFIPHLVDENSGVGTQATVGDLNGDALPDILIANKKGAFVFLQTAACGPARRPL